MASLQRSNLLGLSALTLTTVVMLGAGCSPSKTPSITTINSTAGSTTTESRVTAPTEPTGDATADEAIVEETLSQMNAAQTTAEQAATEVDTGEDVDSYTLPTSVPE